MDVEKNNARTTGPVVFIVEPIEGETYSPETHEPMTDEEVIRSLAGFDNYQRIGPVDELMPDLGERGFGAFKYYPATGRLTQEKAIIDVRLGDNGSDEDLQSLLHWVQYQGTGKIVEHLAILGIDPAAEVLTINVKDKVTVRMPLILLKAMISKHEELETIRLGKVG
ncbi:MAG TPA: hypothetical protein VGK23_01170 [Methanomassiliicoccales archaeon]|jgi:hypothetical protein